MEKIIAIDKSILVYLNNLGSQEADWLWLIITKQLNWAPFFILVFYLVIKKIGWKHFGVLILTLSFLTLVTDQFTNLVKESFERLRPCNDPSLEGLLREVKTSKSFSFFSGHASNSMASTVLIYLAIKKYYKWATVLFIFPLVFAYSRIYLGLHFPLDILTGYVFGATFGFIFYKIYLKLLVKFKL